ncbi:MAG: hypothetical protein VXA34_00265 [Gammaproteobacteria bacterium]
MNNEVLRRKMFRTILADSRAPNGILASSPEMVETVQRRANGGMNTGDAQYMQAIGQLAQQGDKATLENIFRDTRLSTNVRNAAREALGSLTTKTASSPTADFISTSAKQLSRMPQEATTDAMSDAAGFGQGILDAAASENRKFVESIKTAAGNDADRISSFLELIKGTGQVARPGPTTTQTRVASGVQSLLGPKFDALDPRTEPAMAVATPGPAAIPSMLPNDEQRPSVRSPFTPGPLVVDEDIVDDEYTSMPPIRPGEDLAATQPATPAEKPEAAKPETGKVTSASIAKLENLQQDAQSGNLLTPGGKPKTKLNADEAATPEAANALSIVLPEKVSLSEMEEEAKKIMGFDPSKAKEDKKASFWRNLTMAGLAIAAGESENALTNVAKGLMVGLDSYSKDVKELSAQEAEERKEYRATLRTLIKDKRDENIAMAGLQNDFNYKVADLNQRKKQFESTQAFEQEKLGLQMSLAGKQLEVSIATSLAELDLKQQTLDETKRQNIISNQLNELIKKPKFVQNAVAIGLAEVDADGKTTWTDEGKTWLNDNISLILTSSLTSSKASKPTDMSIRSAALARVLNGSTDANDISLAMESEGYKSMQKETGGTPDEVFGELRKSIPQQEAGTAGTRVTVAFENLPQDMRDKLKGAAAGQQVMMGGGLYEVQGDKLVPVNN